MNVPLSPVRLEFLGEQDYLRVWRRMRTYTDTRGATTADAFWITRHPPVYTLGQAGRREHLLMAGDIDVVKSDRGGQVTYHGPGQTIVYTMVDLRRLGVGIRRFVETLEAAVIEVLADGGVVATRREGAPGVYVDGAKIAALGLRVRRGCTYHGVALNVAMDLGPFRGINPCGYAGLEVTQLADLGIEMDVDAAGLALARAIAAGLGLDCMAPVAAGRATAPAT